MNLTRGFYRALGCRDCMVEVVTVKYAGELYSKAHIRILGLTNGRLYETIRNCKLWHHKINHWKKISYYG